MPTELPPPSLAPHDLPQFVAEEVLSALGLLPEEIPPIRLLLHSSGPGGVVIDALLLAASSRKEEAIERAYAASQAMESDRQTCLVVAWLLVALGEPGLAIPVVRRLTREEPVALTTLTLRADLLQALGWEREALDALRLLARRSPSPAATLARAGELLRSRQNPIAALPWLLRAYEGRPSTPDQSLALADTLARAGQTGRARAVLDSLTGSRLARRERDLLELGQQRARLGDFAEAQLVWEELRESPEVGAEAESRLGELARWRGDLKQAERHAQRALKRDPDHPGALRILAGQLIDGGDLGRARSLLEQARQRAPRDPQVLAHLAETSLLEGNPAEALVGADQVIAASDGFSLVGWLLYTWAAIASGRIGAHLLRQNYEEIAPGLAVLLPGSEVDLREGDSQQALRVIQEAMRTLGGNRSSLLTRTSADGSLQRLEVPPGPRFLSREALNLLKTEEAEICLTRMEAAARLHPHSGLPAAHRGELLLWLGQPDEAESAFEEALEKNPFTRWAYIGMGGVHLLRNNPGQAVEWCERGNRQMQSTGPSMFVYRGEARRRLGQRDLAIEDLRASVASHPARVGGWLNLALALGAQESGEVESIWYRLRGPAGGLLHDAAQSCGVEGLRPQAPEGGRILAIFEAALTMLQGNRSSNLVTYRPPRGPLRTVPRERGSRPVGREEWRQAIRLLAGGGVPPEREGAGTA